MTRHEINDRDCPLGTCDFCNAKYHKERQARCRNNPANNPALRPDTTGAWIGWLLLLITIASVIHRMS